MNISRIYQDIDQQNQYLHQDFPTISLAFLEYPDSEYQQYNLLKKYQGHHFQKVIHPSPLIRIPTTQIIKEQNKLFQHPKIMIERRYQRDQKVKNLVQNILLQQNQLSKTYNKLNEDEFLTHYLIEDPQNHMTYYSVKGTI